MRTLVVSAVLVALTVIDPVAGMPGPSPLAPSVVAAQAGWIVGANGRIVKISF